MPVVPDEAHSSPAKEMAQTPDETVSGRWEGDGKSSGSSSKRKAPPPAARSSSKRSRSFREDDTNDDDNNNIDDDRKLPAKDGTTGRGRGRGGSSSGRKEQRAASRRASDADAEMPPANNSLAADIPTKHLLIGKGSQVWNARLQSILRNPKGPPVTAMELLQQAQERLGLSPTRFPPRESPLHSIFQSSTESKGDRKIFECLEECYREMLTQDVDGQETVRKEYVGLRKTAMQQRIGKIFAEENRLKKKEQAMLSKLKGWVSS